MVDREKGWDKTRHKHETRIMETKLKAQVSIFLINLLVDKSSWEHPVYPNCQVSSWVVQLKARILLDQGT